MSEPKTEEDEFLNLKARLADQKMANATPVERAIFESVSEVEHKCVLLTRRVLKLEEEQRIQSPMWSAYQKLSSGYALIVYASGILYALVKGFSELKDWMK